MTDRLAIDRTPTAGERPFGPMVGADPHSRRVRRAATVVHAIGDGERAAATIDRRLRTGPYRAWPNG